MGSEPVSASLFAGRGGEDGFGVVIGREGSARGMVLTSRSSAKGRVLMVVDGSCWWIKLDFWLGDGRKEDVYSANMAMFGGEVANDCGGGGLEAAEFACRAFSSHASRAAGSMGQDDGGGSSTGLAIVLGHERTRNCNSVNGGRVWQESR